MTAAAVLRRPPAWATATRLAEGWWQWEWLEPGIDCLPPNSTTWRPVKVFLAFRPTSQRGEYELWQDKLAELSARDCIGTQFRFVHRKVTLVQQTGAPVPVSNERPLGRRQRTPVSDVR